MDYINNVNALVNQLTCLEVLVRNEDVVMTLFKSLLPSYDYLITTIEALNLNNLTMEFVMARLLYNLSKRKENKPQSDDAAMVSK